MKKPMNIRLEPKKMLHPNFTSSVMAQVRLGQQPARRELRGSYFMKELKKRHKLIGRPAFVLAAVFVLTGSAVAATYWFQTTVNTRSNGDRVIADIEDCSNIPLSELGLAGDKSIKHYSFKEEYRIKDASAISNEDIRLALLAKCEERAFAAAFEKKLPDLKEFSQTSFVPNSKGLQMPVYQSGTVDSVSEGYATVSNIVQRSYLDPTKIETLSLRLRLSSDLIVLQGGTETRATTIKAGDKVYFLYQNQTPNGEVVNPSSLESVAKTTTLGDRSVIRAIGVMSVDPAYIQKLDDAIHSGKVVPIRTDPMNG